MAKREFRAGNRPYATEDPVKKFKVVNCKRLNLRTRPSKESPVVMILNKGAIVYSVGSTGLDWKQVTCNADGKTLVAYCMAEFLEEVPDGPDDSAEY